MILIHCQGLKSKLYFLHTHTQTYTRKPNFCWPSPPYQSFYFLLDNHSQDNISEIFTTIISHYATQAKASSLYELNENVPSKNIGRNLFCINQYPIVSQYCTFSRKRTFYPPVFHLYNLVSDWERFLSKIKLIQSAFQ